MSESSFEDMFGCELTENDVIDFLDTFINKHSNEFSAVEKEMPIKQCSAKEEMPIKQCLATEEMLNKPCSTTEEKILLKPFLVGEETVPIKSFSSVKEKAPINPFFNIKLEAKNKESPINHMNKEIKEEKPKDDFKQPLFNNKINKVQKTIDFQRQSILYNEHEYVFSTNLYKHPGLHYLIKPVIKMNHFELINNLFEDEKNIVVKPLTNTLFYIKSEISDFIFYYVNNKEIQSNGFKDYFEYYLLKAETENSPIELKRFLQVDQCVEAQPYYMFKINIDPKKDNNVYKYQVLGNVFDFITKSLSHQERKVIVKEFIRNDSEYILESAVNKNFLQIAFVNENRIVNI